MANTDSYRFDNQLLYNIKYSRNQDVIASLRNTPRLHQYTNSNGCTLLHFAAKYGNAEITKLLITSGAVIDKQNVKGKTPLMVALEKRQRATILILMDHKASFDITDIYGKTAVNRIIQGSLICHHVTETVLRKLKIDSGFLKRALARKLVDMNCSLRIAMFLDDPLVTRIILDEGIYNIDDPDPQVEESPLHIAVRRSCFENIKLLVKYGADVNAKSLSGMTPLFNLKVQADDEKSLEILTFLLHKGAMMFTGTDDERKCQVANILALGSNKAITILLEHDLDFCAVDTRGSTALHYIARNRNPEIVHVLDGKNINVNVRDNADCTPLHLSTNNRKMMQYLLKHGADPNAERNGVTPLYQIFTESWSPTDELLENIEILLQYGADPQFVSPDGTTIFENEPTSSFYKAGYGLELYEIVIAHMVLMEDLGKPISELILEQINEHSDLKEFYNSYKQQLTDSKETVLLGAITAYKLLIADDKQLAIYMRHPDLKTLFSKRFPFATPKNKSRLHIRVTKAWETAQLWNNATSSFCDALKLPYGKYYYLMEDMVMEYLSVTDMQNLCLLDKQ